MKAIGHQHEQHDGDKNADHGKKGDKGSPFDDPGNGGDESGQQSEGTNHIQNPGIQRDFLGKDVLLYQSSYSIHLLSR
jgi:hypothetical protein